MGRGHASGRLWFVDIILGSVRNRSIINSQAAYTTTRSRGNHQNHQDNTNSHQQNHITMPSYIVTCKDDATPEQVESAKQHARDQGGKITHEYSLIKGFAVEYDNDAVQTLESHEHVQAVEADQEVRTQ
ncbi:Inhibitor I9 domain-containing protein [Fusarium sp. LHS14.1]|nr:Inhibitor I9 domain-containing protein [Fusarium sp. LHS14.1]